MTINKLKEKINEIIQNSNFKKHLKLFIYFLIVLIPPVGAFLFCVCLNKKIFSKIFICLFSAFLSFLLILFLSSLNKNSDLTICQLPQNNSPITYYYQNQSVEFLPNDIIYFTPNSVVFHHSPDCISLKNSIEIKNSALSEFLNKNIKNSSSYNPCKKCCFKIK